MKEIDSCHGKGHLEGVQYKIKLKVVVAFSNVEESNRKQGRYWGKRNGTGAREASAQGTGFTKN